MKRCSAFPIMCCICLQVVNADAQAEKLEETEPKNEIIDVLRLSHDGSGRLRVFSSKNSPGVWQPQYDSDVYPSGWDLVDEVGKSLGCCIEFQADEGTDNLVLIAKHTVAKKAVLVKQYDEQYPHEKLTEILQLCWNYN